MGEVVQLSKFQSKSTLLRAHARAHNIPLIELPMVQVHPDDLRGLPSRPLTDADRNLIDECENIFMEHLRATGTDLRDPDGSDWMLDEREI